MTAKKSEALSKQIKGLAPRLEGLRAKAADTETEGELVTLGATIAALNAKKDMLEARYAEAVEKENAKAAEQARRAAERKHKGEISRVRADRQGVARRRLEWFDEMVKLEARLGDLWREWFELKTEVHSLADRAGALGCELPPLPNHDAAPDLFRRMQRGQSVLSLPSHPPVRRGL